MKDTSYYVLGEFHYNDSVIYFAGVIKSYHKNLVNQLTLNDIMSKFDKRYICEVQLRYNVYKPNVKHYENHLSKFGIRYYSDIDYMNRIL